MYWVPLSETLEKKQIVQEFFRLLDATDVGTELAAVVSVAVMLHICFESLFTFNSLPAD